MTELSLSAPEDCNLYLPSATFSTDIMKSKSNPDILKMAAAAAKRSERTMRSKVSFLAS